PSDNPDPKFFASAVIDLLRRYSLVDRSILQSFDLRTLVEAKRLEPKLRLSALFETERNFCELTEKAGAQIASPDFHLVTASNVRFCHGRRIQVAPWTVNQPSDWRRLIDWGVDGIITDYPAKLVTYL